MPTSCTVEDNTLRVTLLGGQPTGVTWNSKKLQIEVDRKLSGDDGKGLSLGDANKVIKVLIKTDGCFFLFCYENYFQNTQPCRISFSLMAYSILPAEHTFVFPVKHACYILRSDSKYWSK